MPHQNINFPKRRRQLKPSDDKMPAAEKASALNRLRIAFSSRGGRAFVEMLPMRRPFAPFFFAFVDNPEKFLRFS